ncbi:MAG: hypothetical protein ACODAJ_01240 [Planctomycetota bacterium]
MSFALTMAVASILAIVVGSITWMLESDEWPRVPRKGGKETER